MIINHQFYTWSEINLGKDHGNSFNNDQRFINLIKKIPLVVGFAQRCYDLSMTEIIEGSVRSGQLVGSYDLLICIKSYWDEIIKGRQMHRPVKDAATSA